MGVCVSHQHTFDSPGVTVVSGQGLGRSPAACVCTMAVACSWYIVIVAVGRGVGVVTITIWYVGGISGLGVGDGAVVVGVVVGREARVDPAADGVGGKAGLGISVENRVSQTQVASHDAPMASRRDDAVNPFLGWLRHGHGSPVWVLNVGAWDTYLASGSSVKRRPIGKRSICSLGTHFSTDAARKPSSSGGSMVISTQSDNP